MCGTCRRGCAGARRAGVGRAGVGRAVGLEGVRGVQHVGAGPWWRVHRACCGYARCRMHGVLGSSPEKNGSRHGARHGLGAGLR
eukprot:364668-Chlamydomonas_euryale.AAC.8